MMFRAVFAVVLCVVPVAAVYAADPQMTPGPKDHCAVCGMFVAKYKNWISVVVLRDGTKAYFDGPKDMFRYIHDPSKYDRKVKKDDIASIFVKDYYTMALFPAKEAFFVIGSDVLGPMGHELVPLKGKKAAETFLADHRGNKILTFDQITPSVLAEL